MSMILLNQKWPYFLSLQSIMRVNRAKFVRKYLRFFKIVYGISPPFDVRKCMVWWIIKSFQHLINLLPIQIILDGNFIFAALKVKLDIRERLGKLLQGETIRIHVLKSVLTELTAAGAKTAAALEFAKSFCDVIDDTMFEGETPVEKLKAMLGKLMRSENTWRSWAYLRWHSHWSISDRTDRQSLNVNAILRFVLILIRWL